MIRKLLLGTLFILGCGSINAQLSPIEQGMIKESFDQQLEVLSLKCDTRTLGYILAILDVHGFTILSISSNEINEPYWVVNYCKARWSIEDPV